MNDFLRTLVIASALVIPFYLILFGFLAYGWDETRFIGKDLDFEGTWTVTIPEKEPMNIPYKRPVITMMCSLTFIEPYYDCNEKWVIFWLYGNVDGVVCDWGSAGCAYYSYNIVWIEDGNKFDRCGRSFLLHELLHLKYGQGTVAIIHNTENCTNW